MELGLWMSLVLNLELGYRVELMSDYWIVGGGGEGEVGSFGPGVGREVEGGR